MTETATVKFHADYTIAAPHLQAIRDCMIGSFAIKEAGYRYLPHPSQIDINSKEQQVRYIEYKSGAEFDGFPDDTRRELLGKMRIGDTNIILPERLEYMRNDCDGDGMSLAAAIEYAVNNVYQTKYHILVSEVLNAPSTLEGVTQEQGSTLEVRAAIKQYTRESLVQWNFSKVNGINQLSYVKFLEVKQEFDQTTGSSEDVNNYLVMALDEDGNYYQLKYTENETPSIDMRNYPRINNEMLKSLPITFIADEEMRPDCLPIQLGYLWGICDMSLHRYRVSADYKETQRTSSPTIFNNGWKDGDMDIFKEANNNRSYIATGGGAVNNMPDGVTSEVISAASEMTDYHWYFESNEKKIRSMGGEANTQGVAMTATEAGITASKQNALLATVADNAEEAFERALFLCAFMDGIYKKDDIDKALDDIVVELPRDFATPKLTVEEAKEYKEWLLQGAISQKLFYNIMLKGGWLEGDIEMLLAENEEAPPPKVVTPSDND